jgi:2'-5' RNA ligase
VSVAFPGEVFVAISPPEAVNHLTAQIAQLRIGAAAATGINVRLADPANAHLTVAFLGDVPPNRLVDLVSTLGLAAERARDGLGSSPRLALGGGGRFGRGRFTVLWVDLRGEVEVLGSVPADPDRAAAEPAAARRRRPAVPSAPHHRPPR